MTPLALSTLLPPLQNAIAMCSWEDVEDIAGELKRLARLKRLSELEEIHKQLVLKNEAKIAPEASQVANQPTVAFRPEPEITLETRFDEKGHDEGWRNDVACELNWLVGLAKSRQRPYEIDYVAAAAVSIAKRVAEFEGIKAL